MRKSNSSKSFTRMSNVFCGLGLTIVGCGGPEIISTGPGGTDGMGGGGAVAGGGLTSVAGSSSGGDATAGGVAATGGATSVGNDVTGGTGVGTSTGGAPGQVCQPGITQACLGSAQCNGAQACNPTGMGWGACDCGSGTGGSAGLGGGVSTGGANATGGFVGAGGSLGTGGAKLVGGATATGGRATSGATATGGRATGGVAATGGAAATGGNKATGGAAATGGATTACIAMASGGPSAMNHGQACLNCHSGSNPSAGIAMTLAGTIYGTATGGTAVSGATVTVTGSNGAKITMVSGSNGDFYSTSAISFPATVTISKCPNTMTMSSTITNGNCNNCHNNSANPRIHLP